MASDRHSSHSNCSVVSKHSRGKDCRRKHFQCFTPLSKVLFCHVSKTPLEPAQRPSRHSFPPTAGPSLGGLGASRPHAEAQPAVKQSCGLRKRGRGQGQAGLEQPGGRRPLPRPRPRSPGPSLRHHPGPPPAPCRATPRPHARAPAPSQEGPRFLLTIGSAVSHVISQPAAQWPRVRMGAGGEKKKTEARGHFRSCALRGSGVVTGSGRR